MTANEPGDIENTEFQVDNEVTGGEIYFDELIVSGNSYYNTFDEDHEIISLNDIVWIKFKQNNMARKSNVNSFQ